MSVETGTARANPHTFSNVIDNSNSIKTRLTTIRDQLFSIERMFGISTSETDQKEPGEGSPIENAFFPLILDTLADQSSIVEDIERVVKGLSQVAQTK